MTPTFEQLESRSLLSGGLPHLPEYPCDVTSQNSGDWSNLHTWSAVPGNGAAVCILPGHLVNYDRVDAVLDSLVVEGDLALQPNTSLKVGTLVVEPEGSLTATRDSEIVFRDQAIDTSFDPEQLSVGLIGMGVINLQGTEKESFVRLSSFSPRKLVLEHAPLGWKVGDRVSIGSEVRTIALTGGRKVVLDQPLLLPHDVREHVANLSRNVILRSENPNGTRGHVLLFDRADVRLHNVELRDLGRTTIALLDSTTWSGDSVTHVGTNQIGRYSLHLHHLYGPVPAEAPYQFEIVGSAISSTRKWGIAIHDSHFGLLKNNVVFASQGAGIVTEDGSETGNVIEGNLVSQVVASGEGIEQRRPDAKTVMKDFGHEGAGFWFHGSNNYIRDNVASGAQTAFEFWTLTEFGIKHRFPLYPGADTTVPGQYYEDGRDPVVKEFSGNEAYTSKVGLDFMYSGDLGYVNTYVVQDFAAWNVTRYGVSQTYSIGPFLFDGLTVLFQPIVGPHKPRVGFFNALGPLIRPVFVDVLIVNADQEFS